MTGFQKSQHVALLRREKAEQGKPLAEQALDPEFPFAVESWDPAYWRIPAELTPIKL